MTLTEQLDKIKEQEWYQQIQNSYQQLPPEQQTYLKWGSFAGGMLLMLYLTFTTIQSADSVKDEYFEKQELSQLINQASDEIKRLKGQNAGFTTNAAPQSWKSVFDTLATAQGLTADSVEYGSAMPGAMHHEQ